MHNQRLSDANWLLNFAKYKNIFINIGVIYGGTMGTILDWGYRTF